MILLVIVWGWRFLLLISWLLFIFVCCGIVIGLIGYFCGLWGFGEVWLFRFSVFIFRLWLLLCLFTDPCYLFQVPSFYWLIYSAFSSYFPNSHTNPSPSSPNFPISQSIPPYIHNIFDSHPPFFIILFVEV